jgi:hypothetical protein
MARVVFHTDQFLEKVDRATNSVAYEGAKYAAGQMRRRASHDQRMKSAIKIKKSRFKNGGYVVGVFDQSGRWEDSLAARAIYQSYGHAAPYGGRRHVGRRAVVKTVIGNKFIQDSLKATRTAVRRMAKGALKD